MVSCLQPLVILFEIVRVYEDSAAVLADDELLVGCDVDQLLWSYGAETSAAGIAVIDAHHSKVVVHALTDAVVGTHSPGVNLLRTLFPLCLKHLLILGCGFHDG